MLGSGADPPEHIPARAQQITPGMPTDQHRRGSADLTSVGNDQAATSDGEAATSELPQALAIRKELRSLLTF
jgi:hypothetical protein